MISLFCSSPFHFISTWTWWLMSMSIYVDMNPTHIGQLTSHIRELFESCLSHFILRSTGSINPSHYVVMDRTHIANSPKVAFRLLHVSWCIQIVACRLLHADFCIQIVEFTLLHSDCWIQNAASRLLDPERGIQIVACRMLHPKFCIQNVASKMLHP